MLGDFRSLSTSKEHRLQKRDSLCGVIIKLKKLLKCKFSSLEKRTLANTWEINMNIQIHG